KQKIQGLKMLTTIGTQKIDYDSAATDVGASTPLTDFFKSLVGVEFTITFDKDFKITKIEGKEELIKKLSSQNKPVEDLLNSMLNDDAMKELAEPAFSSIPNKAVHKGNSWKHTSKLERGAMG